MDMEERNELNCLHELKEIFVLSEWSLLPPFMHQRLDFLFLVSLDSEMYLLLIFEFRFFAARVMSMNVLK